MVNKKRMAPAARMVVENSIGSPLGAVMSRSLVTLAALLVYVACAFGVRSWIHWRATGSTGFLGVSGVPGSLEWCGGVLFAVGIALGLAAPVAAHVGMVPTWFSQRPPLLDLLAVGLVAAGMAGTLWAQACMGASWRIGVAPTERTELVSKGPFRWVRNPIFSFMLVTAAGFTLLLPNVLSLASLTSLFAAVQIQVRFAEEPYLRRTHGEAYVDYCRHVGRFLPGIGRAR